MILSCIILNYNDAETTITLIEKIGNYKIFDFIIIVDNCSTDDSLCKMLKYKNEKIHIITTSHNGGYGYGNNIGIKYAYDVLKSNYALITNPDVDFEEDTVRALLEALLNNDNCAIAAPVSLQPNGREQKIIAWKLATIKQEMLGCSVVLGRIFKNKSLYDKDYFHGIDYCFVDVLQGSLILVNTELMLKYGMYDEDFFLYCEEQVIGYKFKKNNLKSILLLNETYTHYHSVSIDKSFKSFLKRRKLLFESKLHYIEKYHNVSGTKLVLIKIFFKLIILESFLISLLIRLKKKAKNDEVR